MNKKRIYEHGRILMATVLALSVVGTSLIGCAALGGGENTDEASSANTLGDGSADHMGMGVSLSSAIDELDRELALLNEVSRETDSELAAIELELSSLAASAPTTPAQDAFPTFTPAPTPYTYELAFFAGDEDRKPGTTPTTKPAPPADPHAKRREEIERRKKELQEKKEQLDKAITNTQAMKDLMKSAGKGESHTVTIFGAYFRLTYANSKLLSPRTGISETMALEYKRLMDLAAQVEKVNKNLANQLRMQLEVSPPTSKAVKDIEEAIKAELKRTGK